MATTKIREKSVFAKRVNALGLNFVQLAKISGYKKSSLYSISRGKSPTTDIVLGYIQLLEILQSFGLLQKVLDKYSIKLKGSAMTPTADEIRELKIKEFSNLLEKAENLKEQFETFTKLDTALSEICSDIKKSIDEISDQE